MNLEVYRRKRDFGKTPEPEGEIDASPQSRLFVVQKHAAQKLHYDFRLELNGVLKSWAVPKGPSLDPADKRLAVEVEDHPLTYGSFEGVIPREAYGGGTVMVWDTGEWESIGDPDAAYRKGHLKFRLTGRRLRGEWTLARMEYPSKGEKDSRNWLLIKNMDTFSATGEGDALLRENSTSVLTGRTMEEIAENPKNIRLIIDPAELPGAVRRPQPEFIQPQLATSVDHTPEDGEWLNEIKFDGYRGITVIRNGRARIVSRNGQEWTEKFAVIAWEIEAMGFENAILDGEIVALRPDGTTDLQSLQNLLKGHTDGDLIYYLFDLPYCEGYDLSKTPLIRRKTLLQRLVESREWRHVRFSDHLRANGEEFYRHACRYALEGIIVKRADAAYEPKRAKSWLKIKCVHRQEFVIGGYTDPEGSRIGFGALLLGYYERGRLIYAGRVGTGFNEDVLRDLTKELIGLQQTDSSFRHPPTGREARHVHWTAPKLVAEIAFTSWTRDGILRHASFKGMRIDKSPEEIVRETSAPIAAESGGNGGNVETIDPDRLIDETEKTIAGVTLSQPTKILYVGQGIRKMDLALYYENAAEWILPHIIGRPLSLVRCPQGRRDKCFFQKHGGAIGSSTIQSLLSPADEKKNSEKQDYIYIHNLSGLIALVQLGVLEIHPWPARMDALEKPDRMIFDLDPGEGVEWKAVVDAALLLHERLASIGLQSFVKTTGGKGLHVVVPLARRSSWEEVRNFAEAFSRRVVDEFPDRYVATMRKVKRTGKIFIDFFRNNRGATSIAAYSTRARPGATISVPLNWSDIGKETRPDAYTIQNLPLHLRARAEDPWRDFFEIRQTLSRRMQAQIEEV